jgi:putative transposase
LAHQSPSLQYLIRNFGINLHWAPVDKPQYKAIGERFFRRLNQGLIHKLAGAVRYDVHATRRVGLAFKMVTLDDLTEMIHEFIDVPIQHAR